MSNKPQGYNSRGRPSKGQKRELTKKIKDIKFAKAILESNNLTEAYLKTHPGSTPDSAARNVYRTINPELIKLLKEVAQLEQLAETNRSLIEKILHIVLAKWLNKEERTPDMLQAINILTKLIPEFKERIGIEDLSSLPEDEIDNRLKRLGVNPNDVALN